VNLPLAVALAILPELKKIIALATSLPASDTDLAQAVVSRKEGISTDFRKIWIDTHTSRAACEASLLPQAPGGDKLQFTFAKQGVTSFVWQETIVDFDAGAGIKLDLPWHLLATEVCRIVIMNQKSNRILLTVSDLQTHTCGNREWQVMRDQSLYVRRCHAAATPLVIERDSGNQPASQKPCLCHLRKDRRDTSSQKPD
jgi:hypothetical protein